MNIRANSNILIKDISYFRKSSETKKRFRSAIKTRTGLLSTLASKRQKNIKKFSCKW